MNANLARRLVHFQSQDGKLIHDRNGNPMDHLIDTRGAMSDVELREAILRQMLSVLRKGNYTCVCGVAKSGMIWGAVAADRLGIPYVTVLPDGSRGSGLNRQIEGVMPVGRCAVIDNWIISGGSAKRALEAVAATEGVEPELVLLMCPTVVPEIGFRIVGVFDADDIVSLALE